MAQARPSRAGGQGVVTSSPPSRVCAQCGAALAETVRFCGNCGVAQPWLCWKCRAVNRPAANFCGHCAAPRDLVLKGRYRLVSPLGRGGMGAVYKARDMQLFDRPVVVKEMTTEGLTAAEQMEAQRNFEREAQLLAQLRHHAIPKVHDYFAESSGNYLVMEYIEGQNLAECAPALTQTELLAFAAEVSEVLVYLSQQKPPIVHRDVKPANIMVTGNPRRAMLVDFGVAKPRAVRQSDTTSLGTPGYAPPEQVQGMAEPKSDVYGLAATLYHLLTGDAPGDHPFRFPRVAELPLGLQGIAVRCLQNAPGPRADARELAQALSSLASAEGHLPLRLLDANLYRTFDRTSQAPVGPAVSQFARSDAAFVICLRLANQDTGRPHEHRLFAQFYAPDGLLYRVRTRQEPLAFAAGQADTWAAVFGLRISGTEVARRPGSWRTALYLDERKMIELHFKVGP